VIKPLENTESSFGLNTAITARIEETLVTAEGSEEKCFIVGPLNFD
jgi:hypothetical protein